MTAPLIDPELVKSSSIQGYVALGHDDPMQRQGCLGRCGARVIRVLSGCWNGVKKASGCLFGAAKKTVTTSEGSFALTLLNSAVVVYAIRVDILAAMINLGSTGFLFENFHIYREREIADRGIREFNPPNGYCIRISNCFFHFLGYKPNEHRKGFLDFISRLAGIVGDHADVFGRIPLALSSPALSDSVHEKAELGGSFLLGMGINAELHGLLKSKKIQIEIRELNCKKLTLYAMQFGVSASAITLTFTVDMGSDKFDEIVRQLAVWLVCRIPTQELLKKIQSCIDEHPVPILKRLRRALCTINPQYSISVLLLHKFPNSTAAQIGGMVLAGFASGARKASFQSRLAPLGQARFRHLDMSNNSCCQKICDVIQRRWRSILLFAFAIQDIIDRQKTNTQGIYYEGAVYILSGLLMYDLRILGRYSENWLGRAFVDKTDLYQPDLIFGTIYMFLRVLGMYPPDAIPSKVVYPLLAMNGFSIGISQERFYHGAPETQLEEPNENSGNPPL